MHFAKKRTTTLKLTWRRYSKAYFIFTKNCPDLELVARGKVRDIYALTTTTLLLVATDRISAYDVVMLTVRLLIQGIQSKGKILTQLSVFWFELLKGVIKNHIITSDFDKMPQAVTQYRDQLEGRCVIVQKLEIVPCEAIVRGYITGSAMKEYTEKGSINGIDMPGGLVEAQRLESALFTPSTKAEVGGHDINIHPSKLVELIGQELAGTIEIKTMEIYTRVPFLTKARMYALERGIIIADTKLEFGLDASGQLVLADEVLTPDSSRFWPAAGYKVGLVQPSFDKQYLRDYLTGINFDKKTGVEIPEVVCRNTMDKYVQVYKILTGKDPVL